ncbi:hypothetical protein BX666DRAFT_1901400 [Dichotomocladium elegans]|nr:hypothetical protein BX666DRAFT_1901400 [Dichotomocladium elegans]
MEQEAKLLQGNSGCEPTTGSDDDQDVPGDLDNGEGMHSGASMFFCCKSQKPKSQKDDECLTTETTAVIEECSVYVGNVKSQESRAEKRKRKGNRTKLTNRLPILPSIKIDYATSLEELQAHFETCGNIKRATILSDGETGLSKGFAYIEFATPEAAQAALTLNDSSMRNRIIKVSPKRVNIPSVFLYANEIAGRRSRRGKYHDHHPHFFGRGRHGGSRGSLRGRGSEESGHHHLHPFGRHHRLGRHHPWASEECQGKHEPHGGHKGCGNAFDHAHRKHFRGGPIDRAQCSSPFHCQGYHHRGPFFGGGMNVFHPFGGGGPMHHGPWG